MYICYNCGGDKVHWMADFSYEECGMEGDGIVHTYYCPDCGSRIEVHEPIKEDDEDD